MREIRKSTFREIRSSLGRFMAIFAIIALGVGFFAGLKVTKEGMLATVGRYLDRYAFYDFRLISTIGFDREDVEALAAAEGVEAVEGSVTFDVLYRLEDGSQGAVKVHALTKRVNTVKLLSGRMPADAGECLADDKFVGESAIGRTLSLSEDNAEEDLERFARRQYTIVGIVQSPLYLQYERGNTSLGTGRLDGYLYIPREGFDVAYDTEVYVRFAQEFGLYSEAYDSYVEEKETAWEALAEGAAQSRYQDILEEAEGKLADARAELADKKAEGEAELADAEEKLADAEKKLTDGGQELEDGRQELAEKKQELADGEQTLAQKEQELRDAEELLAQKEAELADGERILSEKEAELSRGEAAFSQGKGQLEERAAQLAAGREELSGNKEALAEQREALAGQEAQLEAALGAGMLSQEAYAEQLRALTEGKQALEAYQAELDAAETTLSEGEAALALGEQQLAETETQLTAGRKELNAAKETLASGRKELAEGKQSLEEGRKAVSDAKEELAEGRKALAEGEAELADAEEELADAQLEYEDGRREYEDARQEFDEKIADAEGEIADAEGEIADLAEPDTYVLGRETNIGYACFENDSDIVEGIANIFPVFFFLVAALVCVTTMNRMVEEQRTQIGVLKALGYGEAAIMSKYVAYSGLAAVTGCVFGFGLGTLCFPKILWFCYSIMYSAEPIFYVFNGRLAVVSMAVSLVCSVGTTWLSCRVELSEVAAALMRPKAPKAGKRVFLERIPFLWRRLSFLRKVSLRNIFRYKKRLFMMALGISGCTALLVTGFGIMDSIADVATKQFEEIQTYDIGISLKEGADEAMRRELDGRMPDAIGAYTLVMERNMDLVAERGVKSVILVAGTEEGMAPFLDLHTAGGEPVAYPVAGEAVISNQLAEDYRVRVGDSITLRDGDMRSITLKVSAIYKNYIRNYVHISEETWELQMGEEPERKTAYLNLPQDGQPSAAYALSADLMQLEQVLSVNVNADFMERIGNMLSSLNIIVVVVILCAAGLAFIVLYNLTNINITERIREIATIKVLGFYRKETAAYVFRENIMLTTLGMVLGLALGVGLHAFVMNEIKVDLMSFDRDIRPVSFLYSALLTIAFAWGVNLAMAGKLDRVSMTESLKSVD